MLTYIITGDNVEISESVRQYVESHYKTFEKFLDPAEDREIDFLVSKNTAHQREDTYKIEARFVFRIGDFFARAENADIISGIDEVKEILLREITARKGKKKTMFRRSAQKVKQFAKGIFGKRG